MTATQQTKAEIRARAMAKHFEDSGWDVKVKVQHEDATLYDHDGSVMLPARVMVHVTATEPGPLSDWLNFGFVTWLPAKGHRSSTRYAGGQLHRFGRPGKKLSLKDVRFRIGMAVHYADFLRQRASEEA